MWFSKKYLIYKQEVSKYSLHYSPLKKETLLRPLRQYKGFFPFSNLGDDFTGTVINSLNAESGKYLYNMSTKLVIPANK